MAARPGSIHRNAGSLAGPFIHTNGISFTFCRFLSASNEDHGLGMVGLSRFTLEGDSNHHRNRLWGAHLLLLCKLGEGRKESAGWLLG